MLTDLEMDQLVSDIGLALPAAKGRKPVSLMVGETRPLNAEDVAIAQATPEGALPTSTAPLVKQLRQRHHQLAQLLAKGVRELEASIQTGYSLSRISILKADPAFRELLKYYSDQERAASVEMTERLAQLGIATIEELQYRLDEDPESFENTELMKMSEMLLDRTGHGKSSTVQIRHGVDEETLALIKRNHEEAKKGKVYALEDQNFIEGSAEEILSSTKEILDAEILGKEEGKSEGNIEPEGSSLPRRQADIHSDPSAEERLDDSEGPELPEGVFRLYRGPGPARVSPPLVPDLGDQSK